MFTAGAAKMNGGDSSGEKAWVIDSHRGAFKGGILENSAPAFAESRKEGANVVETDVRQSADGDLVLVHNRTIDHVASLAKRVPDEDEFGERAAGPVHDHSTAFLQAMEFDHGARIMTIPEFLDWLKANRMGAQIELKEFGFHGQLARHIADAELDYSDLAGPVVVTSFNFLAILRLRKALLKLDRVPKYGYPDRPGIAWGLQAISTRGRFGRWVLRRCRSRGVWGFMTHYKHLPPESISYAHEMGVKFCPRVPDDEELIRKYIAADVDGFETDNVPLIRRCIEEAGFELPPAPH
ncbi:MAG: glycerophosphodiester phosphodiesterase [Promethearchaeota archaeon]